MVEQSSSKLRLNQLWVALNKWRVAFLLFALTYAVILLLNLTNNPLEWDEVIHLNGGSFLNWGLYDKFIKNAFYPPLYDAVTFVFFRVFGVSVFAARLVPVTFSILSLWVLFELAYSMYDGKTALLSAALLGVMPGYFWLSRMALLETMLIFFVSLSIFFFYSWIKKRQDRLLVYCGLTLGLGFLAKYQMLVAAFIIVLSMLFLARKPLKNALGKLSRVILTASLVVLPWIVIAYDVYAHKIFSDWIYAVQVGNPERLLYSGRFPLPVYYLIEMTWPYSDIHPISIFLFAAGLAGLGLLAWRRRKEDKLILVWFVCVYVFFTLIDNKQWRYITPLFPALAVSTAALTVFLYSKAERVWRQQASLAKKNTAKVAAVLLVVLMAGATIYSVNDAYVIVKKYDIRIDIQGATHYALRNISSDESIMVLCPFNFFSRDMVRFYLWADGDNDIATFQYPRLPVDTYTPNFNITEFVNLCRKANTKYVFTYEHGGTVPYFNTTLNLQQIYEQLYASGSFSEISDEATFGANPRRIFVLTFLK